jgi:hypothetical protein
MAAIFRSVANVYLFAADYVSVVCLFRRYGPLSWDDRSSDHHPKLRDVLPWLTHFFGGDEN